MRVLLQPAGGCDHLVLRQPVQPGERGDRLRNGGSSGTAFHASFMAIAATVVAGAYFYSRGKGGTFFSLVSTLAFGTALAAMVSVFCLYIYELPTHHCPFCILQKEYGYIGYVLYAALLGGAVPGLSVGFLTPFRGRGSMAAVIPALQRKLVVTTVILYGIFAVLILLRIFWSPFRLGP